MDNFEKQTDLEIEHAHLRGQLAFNKSLLTSIGHLISILITENDEMLNKTEVK